MVVDLATTTPPALASITHDSQSVSKASVFSLDAPSPSEINFESGSSARRLFFSFHLVTDSNDIRSFPVCADRLLAFSRTVVGGWGQAGLLSDNNSLR